MKRSFLRALVGTTAMVAVAFGFAGQGQAALIDCPVEFTADGTAKVYNNNDSAVSACQIIDPPDPSTIANIETINSYSFFGFSDWMENNFQTQIDTNGQSTGTWSIGSVNFGNFDYIIVFKSGQDTNLTGFLFNEDYSSGGWSTPFTDPPFNLPGNSTSKEVSHYTIAKRGAETPPTDVPEPASLALLGVGLLGLGYATRRRRQAV